MLMILKFIPYDFAQSFHLLAYILGPKGRQYTSHRNLYIGELSKVLVLFVFFSCDGIIKGIIATKKKVGRGHSILLI
jgi:hypothetical protein